MCTSTFSHLEEVEESHKWCFAHLFFPVSKEEPPCDAGVQQLRGFLGQRHELEALFPTVSSTEKTLSSFINPRGTWQENRALLQKTKQKSAKDKYTIYTPIIIFA